MFFLKSFILRNKSLTRSQNEEVRLQKICKHQPWWLITVDTYECLWFGPCSEWKALNDISPCKWNTEAWTVLPESPKLTTHYKVPEDWSWTTPLPARWYRKGAWCSLSMVEEYRTARVGAHRLKEMLRCPRSQSSVEKSQWREFGASSGKHANRSQVQVNFEYCPCPLCWQPNTRRAAMLLGKKPKQWHFLLPYLRGLAFVIRSAKQVRNSSIKRQDSQQNQRPAHWNSQHNAD